jgi:hypothetical protein
VSDRQVLTAEGAIGLLRLIVFEKGSDYVYRVPEGVLVCRNFVGQEPSCLVGHALNRLGLSGNEADRLGIEGGADARHSCRALSDSDFAWSFSDDAIRIFEAAQLVQDDQGSWGSALAIAERVFQEILDERPNPVEISDDLC